MAFLRSFLGGKQAMRRKSSSTQRGFMAVYVGENDETKKRYVVPVSYLNHHLFQELLSKSEEEFGFDHPMGGLNILCHESLFLTLTLRFNEFQRHSIFMILLFEDIYIYNVEHRNLLILSPGNS